MTADRPRLPLPADITLGELHRFCATTAAAYREAHGFTGESHEYSYKAVAWLGGLMGAGIFSVHGLLSTAPPIMRLTVILPWAAGIVCAMLAGLLAGEAANRNNAQHFDRISMLELLQLQTNREVILNNLAQLLQLEVLAKKPANIVLNRWLAATNTAFYLAHVFFVVGVVAAVTTMIVLGR